MLTCLAIAVRRRMRLIMVGLMLGVGLIGSVRIYAAPLLLTYIEKPPLYFTDHQGLPTGILLDQVRQAFADQPFTLEARSPRRALAEIRTNKTPVCSIGWYKTPDRQAFAVFSAPLYREPPMVVLVRAEQRHALVNKASLTELLADRQVRMGVVAGFSYGAALDQRLQPLAERIDAAPDESSNLRKLVARRIDAILVNDKELEYYLKQAKIRTGDVIALRFPDMPQGEERFLMCGQKMPAESLQKFNAALRLVSETRAPKR